MSIRSLWIILTSMRHPHPQHDDDHQAFLRERKWLIEVIESLRQSNANLEANMSALTDAVAANTAATSANTDAVNAAVAKINTGGTPSDAQEVADAVTAITANTATITANNDALTAATPAA